MGERGSSSEMANEMENVRLLLLKPGGTMAPRAPSIPHKGAGPVFLGTFSDTQTHIHILTACAQRSTTTHTRLTYISRDVLMLYASRSTPPNILKRRHA